MKKTLLVLALLLSTFAQADEASKRAKIAQIVEAQGLQQMFQQQLDQYKVISADLGKNLYRKMLAESGVPEGQEIPKLERVFTKYLEGTATMFSAQELVASWSSFYGKDLSESDLDQILAYYQSAVGKKEVRASQLAMVGFSQAMAIDSQERLNASIGQLMADLKAAMEN